jgi:predicted amino acid-binding ACT domain protein
MSVGLRLYEQLSEAQDDKTRARLIAEAFDALENLYPHLQDLATQGHLRETELRLQKEIKEVEAKLHKEILEVEAALRVEIEKVRLEIKEVELRLQREIRGVEVKVAESKAELVRWVVGVGLLQTTLLTAVLLRIAHLI